MRHLTAKQINDNWCFHLGECSPEALKRTHGLAWSSVTLPHIWNALDTMEVNETRHYTRAIGWYAREVEPPPGGQRLWIEVEAASQRASIWCNGTRIGEHAGGYTAFTFELDSEQSDGAQYAPLTLAL